MESKNTNKEIQVIAVAENSSNLSKKEEEDQAQAKAEESIAMEATKSPKKTRNHHAPLTIVSFLTSLPVLGAAIWQLCMKDYACEDLLRMPGLRVSLGIGMLLVFIISNVTVFHGHKFLMPGLVAVMVPLITMFTMGLALVGAYKMESRSIPASPMWLKSKIYSHHNWADIKSCIFDTKICEDLGYRTLMLKSYDFRLKQLSPIESGCCSPPAQCELVYQNATFWVKNEEEMNTEEGSNSKSDCVAWSNKQNHLCYDCETCKEGFLSTLQGRWWKLGVFHITMAIFLVIVHTALFVNSVLTMSKT